MFRAAAKWMMVLGLGLSVLLGQARPQWPVCGAEQAAPSVAVVCGCGTSCGCCYEPATPADERSAPQGLPAQSAARDLTWLIAEALAAQIHPQQLSPTTSIPAWRAVPATTPVAIFQRDCSFLI